MAVTDRDILAAESSSGPGLDPALMSSNLSRPEISTRTFHLKFSVLTRPREAIMRGNLSTHHHSYFLLNTSSVPVPCYPYRYHLQASPHREVGTIIISALQTRYQCSKAVTCPRSQRLEAVLHLEPHSSSSVATSWEPTPRPAWCLLVLQTASRDYLKLSQVSSQHTLTPGCC